MLSRWFGFRVHADEIDVIDGDSIAWRRGGMPEGEGPATGEVKYRLKGIEAPALTERAECKSEREARWGEAAMRFLESEILRASKIRLKPTGERTPRGQDVAVLLIDGRDAADIMIEARMAKRARWAEGRFVRYDWDDLWDERPDVLR